MYQLVQLTFLYKNQCAVAMLSTVASAGPWAANSGGIQRAKHQAPSEQHSTCRRAGMQAASRPALKPKHLTVTQEDAVVKGFSQACTSDLRLHSRVLRCAGQVQSAMQVPQSTAPYTQQTTLVLTGAAERQKLSNCPAGKRHR